MLRDASGILSNQDAYLIHNVFNSPIENHQLGWRACVALSRKPLLELRQRNIGYAVYDNGDVTVTFMPTHNVSTSQSQSAAARVPLSSFQPVSNKNSTSAQKKTSLSPFDASVLSKNYKQKKRFDRLAELQKCFPNTILLFKDGGAYYGYDGTAVAMDMLFHTGYFSTSGHRCACSFNISMLLNGFGRRNLRYILDDNGVTTFCVGKGFALANSLSSYPMSSKAKNVSQSKSKPKTQSYNGPYERSGYGWDDDTWTPGLPSSRFYRKRKH